MELNGKDSEKIAVESPPEKIALENPPAYVNGAGTAIPPRTRLLHDPDVSFHEYHHYARLTRQDQDNKPKPEAGKNLLAYLIPNLQKEESEIFQLSDANLSDRQERMNVTDEEWANASRAMRLASAGAVFYLITTDIFGPFGLPFAFATMGWGPGVALYTVFAAMAGYSGYLLWDCFMGTDSYEFPIKSFGDITFRVCGTWGRYGINILQAIQLLCNVGAIVISNGQALSEASNANLCYAVCCLVWALAGFFFGQIRTLKKFSWLANVAVFINLLIMFLTMGGASHSPPRYSSALNSAGSTYDPKFVAEIKKGLHPPVYQTAGLPNPGNFAAALNGAMQAVYSFGGAMIFPEIMAEIRRPRDFLKGMWGAQLFIYICYMLYGLFMYGFQGQYVQTPAYLGISARGLSTAGNALAIVSALIAATLYGNIGVKVIYDNILVEFFRAPLLTTRAGKRVWMVAVPIYWSIAYIIAAAIPDFIGFTGIVAAVCILNFTYTFPPMLHVAFSVKKNAAHSEPGFDPQTGEVTKQDSGMKRFIRGFFGRRWYVNVFNVLYMLASLALCALGTYASALNLKIAFTEPQYNAFTCKSPVA